MTQMDQVIQRNASEEMFSQAESLEQMMIFFKVAGDNRIGTARSAVLAQANRTGDVDFTLPVPHRSASRRSRLCSARRQTASSVDKEFKPFA